MAKPSLQHIPLRTNEAISLLGRVKPTADMPRPGPTGKRKKRAKKPVAKRMKG